MNDIIVQQDLFNYSQCDTETRLFVQEKEAQLEAVLKRTSKEIGAILLEVKERLPHGQYTPWLASRGISQSTAWRCMQAAQDKEIKKSFIVNDLMEPIAPPALPMREPEPIQIEYCSELPVNIPVPSEVDPEPPSHFMQLMSSSDTPEWYTPENILDPVLALFGTIDVDPCSNSHQVPAVPARTLYTKEDDGLLQEWHGKVYLNPPYGSEIPEWVQKLLYEYQAGHVKEAIALVPGRIDTAWFFPFYDYPMCHIRGRLKFVGAPSSAPFPSIVVYLGGRIEAFIEAFKGLGPIMGAYGIEWMAKLQSGLG